MRASGDMPDLSWLADAPVFIDSQQIGAFYEAVVGPAFRTVQLQVTASQTVLVTALPGRGRQPCPGRERRPGRKVN